MTWSVKDGGRLCMCGHLKCQHENGSGPCKAGCAKEKECPPGAICSRFIDGAPETAAA